MIRRFRYATEHAIQQRHHPKRATAVTRLLIWGAHLSHCARGTHRHGLNVQSYANNLVVLVAIILLLGQGLALNAPSVRASFTSFRATRLSLALWGD